MSSVRAIAEKAGVSISTVSRVLNNADSVSSDTRERVLSVVGEVGPTRRTTRGVAGGAIGLVYAQAFHLSHRYESAIVDGAFRALSEAGYGLSIVPLSRDRFPRESFTQYLTRRGIRGALLRVSHDTRDVCLQLARDRFPHVVLSERFDEPEINWVDANSYVNTLRAVEYLIGLGHREIAFVTHDVVDRDHADRFEGYCAGLKKHNLETRDEIVFRYPYTYSGGATAMRYIASMSPRPTAIICADPAHGVGVINTAHALGIRVPDEMSVIGFDDSGTRFEVYPTMTAVCQDASLIGVEAARWLTHQLEGAEPTALRREITTFFEINDSTGPAPKQ